MAVVQLGKDRRVAGATLPMRKRISKMQDVHLSLEGESTDAGSTSSDTESGRCSSAAEVSPAQMDLVWPNKPLPPGQIQRGQDLPPKFSLLPGQVFRNIAADKPGAGPEADTRTNAAPPTQAQPKRHGPAPAAAKRRSGRGVVPGPPAPKAHSADAAVPGAGGQSTREVCDQMRQATALGLPLKVKLPDYFPAAALDKSMPAKKHLPYSTDISAKIALLAQVQQGLDPLMPAKKLVTDFLVQPILNA
mmetsp:Transcript_53426/g.124394  ORF Transcript_53426/g.124394 Transcript_53426/m.124394 type:complete len:247 (-) Transcript_53426:78-818(-)